MLVKSYQRFSVARKKKKKKTLTHVYTVPNTFLARLVVFSVFLSYCFCFAFLCSLYRGYVSFDYFSRNDVVCI